MSAGEVMVCARYSSGLILSGSTIARVPLCLDDGALVAVHVFIKKTRKTPDDELALARQQRQKDLKS